MFIFSPGKFNPRRREPYYDFRGVHWTAHDVVPVQQHPTLKVVPGIINKQEALSAPVQYFVDNVYYYFIMFNTE